MVHYSVQNYLILSPSLWCLILVQLLSHFITKVSKGAKIKSMVQYFIAALSNLITTYVVSILMHHYLYLYHPVYGVLFSAALSNLITTSMVHYFITLSMVYYLVQSYLNLSSSQWCVI